MKWYRTLISELHRCNWMKLQPFRSAFHDRANLWRSRHHHHRWRRWWVTSYRRPTSRKYVRCFFNLYLRMSRAYRWNSRDRQMIPRQIKHKYSIEYLIFLFFLYFIPVPRSFFALYDIITQCTWNYLYWKGTMRHVQKKVKMCVLCDYIVKRKMILMKNCGSYAKIKSITDNDKMLYI